MQRANTANSGVYEVDLVQLFKVVWLQKWLVAIVTLVFTLAAAAYAFSLTAVYEAKSYIAPPTNDDISALNSGRTEDLSLKKFTVDEVFKIFLAELQSQEMRQSFFQNVYLPSLAEGADRKADRTYSGFSQSVIVAPADKEGMGRWSVSIQGGDPSNITNLTSLYVEEAARRAEREVMSRVHKELGVLSLDLQTKIGLLRELGERERQDTITRLKESIFIAKAIGLENPLVFTGTGAARLLNQVADIRSYMRGRKVLESELKVAEERKSNDPFIPGLRNLQAKLESYQALMSAKPEVWVFDKDSLIQQQAVPIKSRKMFIILVGIILGGMTGLVIALIRSLKLSSRPVAD